MANQTNLQNLRFPELLSCDVKRLTRPRFNHEFTQFNDSLAFKRLTGEEQKSEAVTEDLLGLNDNSSNATNNTTAAAAATQSTQQQETEASGKSIQILDIEQDYDPAQEQSAQLRDQQWDTLGANRHDIAYDNIPADCALNYISTFGKISTGENFRVLFTIQNESSAYALQNINMRVRVQKRSNVLKGMQIDRRRYEAMSRDEQKRWPLKEQEAYPFELEHVQNIPQLAAKQQLCFNFSFKINHSDFYIMFIRFDYTSQYFEEQLSVARRNVIQDVNSNQREIKARDGSIIDLVRNTVVKQNNQKFKFEALKPFETQTKVDFTNNCYLIQVKVRNVSANKIFIESLQFNSLVGKDLQLIDLNKAMTSPSPDRQQSQASNGRDAIVGSDMFGQEGLFDDTVCFHQDEIRQFLFYLKPIKPKFRIDNSIQHKLGSVNVTWRNYMGDLGQLELEKVTSITSVQQQSSKNDAKSKEIEIELVEPQRLTLEKPQKVQFRFHNLTKNYMRLQLLVEADRAKQGDVLICGCYPQIPGKIEGLKSIEFELELLPLVCGVGSVSGLRILDMISGKQYELDYHFAKFTIDFKDEVEEQTLAPQIFF